MEFPQNYIEHSVAVEITIDRSPSKKSKENRNKKLRESSNKLNPNQ